MSLLKRAAVVCLLTLTPAGLALGQQPRPSTALRGPLTLVQFQVVSGRILVKAKQPNRSSTWSSTSRDRTERMRVMLNGPEPQIDYELATPGMRLTINVAGKSRLNVRRERRNDMSVVPLEFSHEADGPLQLAWGAEPDRRQASAASLWHLCLAEPEVSSEHLLPLLELLRQGWRLAETAEEITDKLCQDAADRQPLPFQDWAALVTELGSQQFARRQAADRQLRAAGQTVRAFLESFDRSQLDAEQRHRVGKILASLSKQGASDSAETVSEWLAADPQVWFALLQSPDASRRRLAAARLAQLWATTIDFNPDAPKEKRQEQIDALRPRLE